MAPHTNQQLAPRHGAQFRLDVTTEVTIQGNGEALSIIDAGGAAGLGDRVFEVQQGASLTIENITVRGGSSLEPSSDKGGALFIEDDASLTLQNATLTGNTADSDGGAFYADNRSVITITDSTISGNTSGDEGGGIYGDTDTMLMISGSLITGNGADASGGGIQVRRGIVTINDSTISDNRSGGDGGGIHERGNQQFTVTNSRITGNMARNGGGILSEGELTVIDSVISGNSAMSNGGGVYSDYQSGVSITGSTISGNTAEEKGGGVYNYLYGTLSITNSTISGNSADKGGGLYDGYDDFGYSYDHVVTLTNSTITGNTVTDSGGGIYADAMDRTVPITLNNTIVAGNGMNDLDGGTFGGSNNIIQDSSDVGTGLTNTINEDPLLGPLADNGGPTQTHALLAGSAAIDAGDNDLASEDGTSVAGGATQLTTDQRGTGFARILGGTVDIGAFEAIVSAPQAPVNVVANNTETVRPTITWDAEPNATSYGIWFIKLAEGATPGSVVAGQSGLTSLSFTPDADLAEGNYSAWVRSINAAGASTWSIPATFRIGPMVTIPAAPASVTVVDATVARPTIEWTPSTDLATGNYRVYVRAFNSAGVSAWSTPLTFFSGTLSAPQPPTDVLVVDPSVARPEIQWTDSAEATSYGIWFIDQAGGVVAGESGLSGLSFTPDSDLTPGHNYSVYIRAFNLAGVSNWSTPLTFRAGEPETIPQAPQNVTAINTNTPRPTIQWDAVQDAMSYGIWFVNLAGGVVAGESGLTDLSFTPNTDLADGNYRVWIRAFNSAGVSDWSTPLDLQILTVAEVDISPVGKSLSSALELVSPIEPTSEQEISAFLESHMRNASQRTPSLNFGDVIEQTAGRHTSAEWQGSSGEDTKSPVTQREAAKPAANERTGQAIARHGTLDLVFSDLTASRSDWLDSFEQTSLLKSDYDEV